MSTPKTQTYERLLLGSGKSSEMWRRETEARTLLTWPLYARREQLEKIEKARGKPAVEMLKQDMTILFEKGRL